MFFLLYKHTDDGVFDDFPKICDHFPKILQNCFKGQTNVPEHSPIIFKKFPKITEDFRGRPEDVEMIHQRIPSESKCNLRDKIDITEIIDVFTCEDIASFLSICYHSLYRWLKINYFLRSKKDIIEFLVLNEQAQKFGLGSVVSSLFSFK